MTDQQKFLASLRTLGTLSNLTKLGQNVLKNVGAVKNSLPLAEPKSDDFVQNLLSKLGVSGQGVGLNAGLHAGLRKAPVRTAAPLPVGAQFLSGTFGNRAGSRHYKLYVPACYVGEPLPLVVMLHGCTQDPDDFAAGTQMNEAAETQRCLVLYPQQSQTNNHSKCWNWFNAADQQRDVGEPSIIADLTREIMARYAVERQQVYVAGLSAGGAMAAIMGTLYPDLYAGVAVHSGLPYGAAADLPSALSAMRSGVTGGAALHARNGNTAFKGIPVIVFHGDADHTVNQRNGEQVLSSTAPADVRVEQPVQTQGSIPGGHTYTRTVRNDARGKSVAEHWLIHGFGHAWAGGSPHGSYTDARGPDATDEMMRFFYTQRLAS
ncbi:MAG: PHB depolymerase family esterase [Pseudomonadota bacterium]